MAEDQITDIHNCECFENVRKIYPSSIILPLIVNTDGAQLHRASKNSLWLIQCYQAFLPPAKRYNPANILIVAAHFGKKKPNMHEFFYEFLKEIREIQNNGGLNMTHKGNEYNFMPVIIGLSCDIPAKKEVLCTVGHAGRFACNYCLHPGNSVKQGADKKSYVRYVKGSYELRSHESMLNLYKKIRKTPINGVTGVSPMVAAKHFNLVHGVAIEFMHNGLWGL